MLNLESGRYHGLNPTAGRMLELLGELGEVDAVAEAHGRGDRGAGGARRRGPARLLLVARRARADRGRARGLSARRSRHGGRPALHRRPPAGPDRPGSATSCPPSRSSAPTRPRSTSAGRTPRRRSSIFERPFRDGRPFLRVERDERAGYRVWAVGARHAPGRAGRHATARRRCPDGPPWRALKLLASQTLPLLAALRGREVLHAAGVVVGERLIGLVAASGTGKSATTCNVIAQGGRFFADDVLAMEVADGRVRAHPGTRLLNLFAHDLEAIPETGRARLGEPSGESDKVHFVPDGFPRRAAAVGRSSSSARGRTSAATASAPVENASSQLLGNAFLPYLDSARAARAAARGDERARPDASRSRSSRSRRATSRPRVAAHRARMGGGAGMSAAAGAQVERLLRKRMPADLRLRVALEIVAHVRAGARADAARRRHADVVDALRDDAVDAHDALRRLPDRAQARAAGPADARPAAVGLALPDALARPAAHARPAGRRVPARDRRPPRREVRGARLDRARRASAPADARATSG